MQEWLKSLADTGTDIALKLLYALIIVLVGIKLSNLLVKWVSKGRAYQKIDPSVRSFLNSTLKIVSLLLVFLTAAYVLGIPMTSFIAVLASCGLAIGLALQGALSNLAGGLMILLFKPFSVGDYIDANGKEGTVESITIFYTVLHTPENKVVTIPNGTITASDITNHWTLKTVRLDVPCSTAPSVDVDKTKAALLQVATQFPQLLPDPAPEVLLIDIGGGSLDYILRVWVNDTDYWTVKFAMNEAVKRAFDREGIAPPIPTMNILSK